MEYSLSNEFLAFSLNEKGLVSSVENRQNGHSYCKAEGEPFRMILAYDEYEERPADAAFQTPTYIVTEGNSMKVHYDTLRTTDRVFNISLTYTYTLSGRELHVNAHIENRETDVQIPELQTTAFAGIAALDGHPENDKLLVPRQMGFRIDDPSHADFFRHSMQFKKKYERPDQRHSDFDALYPGFSCMQWFALYNENECIYIGNHDGEHRILSMHTERNVKNDTLRLGVAQYPFLETGETYDIPEMVYALLPGDWHEGAKLYRHWMETKCGWKAPEIPEWARDFQGWLRLIFRTQSGEYNFRFEDIPRLFDEVQAAGLNTIYILGWPRKGFGHYRPDYYVAEDRRDALVAGIDYVHKKGGKVILFISYHAVDQKSEYYQKENGEEVLMRDFWGDRIRFSETYGVDATYRKVCNMPHSQFCTCSGSDKWHEKMKKSADTCISLGADGVLYDLGGTKPYFCFAENHDHKKPNTSRASKARRYAELRANIKQNGKEKIILQEHCIDIYAQHMDIVQPPTFNPRNNTMPEMFRYTFPEIRMTNRNLALDEEKYLDSVNFSFIYGLAFDMSIYRCAGTLSDIPHFTAYMKEAIAMREKYRDYFFLGTFTDEDGFTHTGDLFRHKSYRTPDGRLGVAVWNDTKSDGNCTYTNTATGKTVNITLKKDSFTFAEL